MNMRSHMTHKLKKPESDCEYMEYWAKLYINNEEWCRIHDVSVSSNREVLNVAHAFSSVPFRGREVITGEFKTNKNVPIDAITTSIHLKNDSQKIDVTNIKIDTETTNSVNDLIHYTFTAGAIKVR